VLADACCVSWPYNTSVHCKSVSFFLIHQLKVFINKINADVYTNNSLHLAWKYAGIFAHGHYLLREVISFPRVQLKETVSFWGTDNVYGQIIRAYFCTKWRLFVYNFILQIFFATCMRFVYNFILQILFATCMILKIGEYYLDIPQF